MVSRTRGVRKIVRKLRGRMASQNFVTAGDRACWRMVREARSRKRPGPSDQAILAWANYDLTLEILTGYWDFQAA